ncbi:hypothetical protein FUA23_14630 [Neolewinella aurantiaca]|uniref:Mannosyl-glycoprotein endo-beta-N-acetylglucosamidase-like domain-containing protein n=1 Tax=Neolewinella aurantiaca TaxID=2602767 RepID=A0A5C7FCW8_9BACT|nr:glucosaminidase domain-containing protein [Neolewinella aurantiaca]TXF88517.1 hypothetical protein FUA23_14630 [Neolewinella aurantiaca]
MTSFLSRLMSFAGRHWLRLLIIVGALVLLSDKQVNFNLRLGAPSPAKTVVPNGRTEPAGGGSPEQNSEKPILTESEPVSDPVVRAPEKAGFLERFNLFGSDKPDKYDELTRREEQVIAAFIRRFSNVAQAEQEKFGIPASITLANALLHGQAGEAPAARSYLNYFALGCHDEWSGSTGRVAGQCVRAYENAWTSFRDHSLYITSDKYSALTQFSETDYRRWAAGLEELGFNDSDELAEQLLRTIDKFQLFRFD